MAERESDGSLRVKIPHYRYAEDGLLLWDAIENFVDDYLRLYYDDSKPGERVSTYLVARHGVRRGLQSQAWVA